ncbi:MAG: phosphatase [Rhodococcus sp.]|nr:phosphatase [Rhodococcus sp. (in: high G+C Gram-positive bacteria)]
MSWAPATAVADPVAPNPSPAAVQNSLQPTGSLFGNEPSYDEWIADVVPVADEAKAYLEQRLPSTDNPAVVFDIDNTTLETHYNFGLFRVPAIDPMLEVAQLAEERGAAIFFVTGRPGFLQPITRPNLISEGYTVDGLYQTGLLDVFNLQKYKTAARADIESEGYTIVANIGNNASDLAGGHAERTFKLPDYDGALS